MGTINYFRQAALVDLYKSGRNQTAPTLQAHKLGDEYLDIGGSNGIPVEAVLADPENNPLGACWIAEIDDLLLLAEFEEAKGINNANQAPLREIYRHMAECRFKLDQPFEPKSDTAKTIIAANPLFQKPELVH